MVCLQMLVTQYDNVFLWVMFPCDYRMIYRGMSRCIMIQVVHFRTELSDLFVALGL